ncbi:alpha-ribazole phosphatase [Halanaerobium hydrogeniformans]|uniref:alpha-ribazole phosphatase n=1 Tax=Halanaerobium hydrogeniformans TaxID=656519 RepID=UPI0002E013BB|nr:alpha-ribazole phosphatase [Halanaerobium hydrogeniformans]
MATKMLLIRHGETDWNKELIFQGHSDTELNEKGIKNAKKNAELLKDLNYDYIYCSDLKRAKDTAGFIADKLNKKIIESKEIRELDFGKWEGLDFKSIEEKYPDEFKAWQEDFLKNNPPGGEKISDFTERVNRFFKSVLKKHRDKKIIVVTHGGVIKTYLTEIMAVPKKRFWQFQIENNSLTEIKFTGEVAVLTKLNLLYSNNFK